MTDNTLIPLIGKSLDELREIAQNVGLKPFQGGQMAKWLYEKRVKSIDEMTDLSIAGRQRLAQKYCVGRQEPDVVTESIDGTRKYLFYASSGNAIESVYIPEDDRATLCI